MRRACRGCGTTVGVRLTRVDDAGSGPFQTGVYACKKCDPNLPITIRRPPPSSEEIAKARSRREND